MRKKIFIVSTSLRSGSNSNAMADAFLKGAVEAGHRVCKVSLQDMQIQFCNGCLLCQKTGSCVIQDALSPLLEDMRHSDVIVFATPIYFQDISGQLKTLLDRSTSLYFSDYMLKEVYLLISFSDTDTSSAEHASTTIKNWANALGIQLAGTVMGIGLDKAEDFRAVPQILEAAYQMGREV